MSTLGAERFETFVLGLPLTDDHYHCHWGEGGRSRGDARSGDNGRNRQGWTIATRARQPVLIAYAMATETATVTATITTPKPTPRTAQQ
jgi:hypothetical protein